VVSCFIHHLGYPWFELLGAQPSDTTMGRHPTWGLVCVCSETLWYAAKIIVSLLTWQIWADDLLPCVRSFKALQKEAGLLCRSFLRKGEVFAYGGLSQDLKDLKNARRGGFS